MVDFLTQIGRKLGISNREGATIGAQLATGNYGQAALTTLTSLGGGEDRGPQRVDVSGPPAGVDSVATTLPVSRTGMIGGPTGDGAGILGGGGSARSNQAFIGGFGVPGIIGGATRLLSRPGVGGALTGIGAGFGFDRDWETNW